MPVNLLKRVALHHERAQLPKLAEMETVSIGKTLPQRPAHSLSALLDVVRFLQEQDIAVLFKPQQGKSSFGIENTLHERFIELLPEVVASSFSP